MVMCVDEERGCAHGDVWMRRGGVHMVMCGWEEGMWTW